MFISKKKHHKVVDRLEAEKAALEVALQEEQVVMDLLTAQVVHSVVAKCEAETALNVALKGSALLVKKAESAAELALAKYGEAVG